MGNCMQMQGKGYGYNSCGFIYTVQGGSQASLFGWPLTCRWITLIMRRYYKPWCDPGAWREGEWAALWVLSREFDKLGGWGGPGSLLDGKCQGVCQWAGERRAEDSTILLAPPEWASVGRVFALTDGYPFPMALSFVVFLNRCRIPLIKTFFTKNKGSEMVKDFDN